LYCENNQLTTSALNDLFGTLHGNTSTKPPISGPIGPPYYSVFIKNNPGASNCEDRIAEGKGWMVYR